MASLLLRSFALGFAIAASPGPIFFLCLRRTLLRGWRIGVASGLGVASADGFYAAVAVFGIAAVATRLAAETRWLEALGGTALIVIGLRSLIATPGERPVQPRAGGGGLAWAYVSTLGLTITNPTTIISFAALAAALGAGLSGGIVRPTFVVAGVALGSAAWWCVMSALVALLRARVTPAVARAIGMVSGLAIAALGTLAVVAALAG